MTTQSDWIEWKGGECPVSEGTRVDVRFRDGDIDEDGMAGIWNWDWVFDDSDINIVAYRVLDAKAGDRS